MDRSKVMELVEKHMGPLKAWFDLHRWDLTVECARLDDGLVMECVRLSAYNRATIRINADWIEAETDFLEHFVHEFVHLILAPFDLYRNHALANYEAGATPDRQETPVWAWAVEQTDVHICRIFRERMLAGYLAQFGEAESCPEKS